MDYIQLAIKGKTDWWRYLIGAIFIFFIWQLGTLIHFGAVMAKIGLDGGDLQNIGYEELMTTLSKNLTFFLLLLSFVFGAFAVWFIYKFFHEASFKDLITTRAKFDWKRFWVGFWLIGGLIILFTSLDYYYNPSDYLVNFQWDKFLILLIIGILLVPIQTTFEELFFRGYLLQGIGILSKNRGVALVITSVVFGLLHLANPEVDKIGKIIMVSYIGTGFLLGIMALMDEGLELSIGFHAGNNLVTALLVTADWTAFQTESIFISLGEPDATIEVLFPVLIVYPIFLLILARVYKWKNWKEKLFGNVSLPNQNTH